MTDRRRIGILGGTFDPIHVGHVDVAAAAADALNLERLFVIPANIPPHRAQPVASGFHRFAMAAMAVTDRPGWRVLDLELQSREPSYSSTTLRRFHADGVAPTDLFFITGADAFLEIGTWHDYPRVLDLAHFAVVSRPGTSVDVLPDQLADLRGRMVRLKADPTTFKTSIFLIDARTADVSSTAIRHARQDHRSIAGMVPPSVQQHIERHDLYAASSHTPDVVETTIEGAAGRLHGEH